jgi:WD40 repeat protein
MPDVQEVFRMATEKVKPDPNALERQIRRQRRRSGRSRAAAYAVAAAVIVIVIAAVSVLRTTPDEEPAVHDTTTVSFTPTLPGGAASTSATVFDPHGKVVSTIDGMPPDAYAYSVSADGDTVAFMASGDDGLDHLGVVAAAGGTAQMVPTPSDLLIGSTIGIGTESISPDGTKIAFEAINDGNSDVYVVGVDGSGLVRLTEDPATDQYPQWSPDGSTIVYDNGGSNESTDPQFSKTGEIFSVPADGTGSPTQLTHDHTSDANPSYSSDGRRIAYAHGGAIWTMTSAGTHAHAIADGRAVGFTPRWSPDDTTIVYTYYVDAPRPMVALASQYGEQPIVVAAVIDTGSGRITRLRKARMATDYNTAVWLDRGHILVSLVGAGS